MSEKQGNTWIDLTEKLWVPVLIFLGGITYTVHKDRVDSSRQIEERNQADRRQQLERDSGYIRMLASANDKERDLGLRIIAVLQSEGKFSQDLAPVVYAMSAGRPSDPATQAAARIVSNVAMAKQPVPETTSATTDAPTDVFIQIWHEGQRQRATELQQALRAKGFATPGIELVPHATFHTYVRYFALDKVSKAAEVSAIMAPLGFKPQVQDFAHSQEPKSEALEVWFGADEPVSSRE